MEALNLSLRYILIEEKVHFCGFVPCNFIKMNELVVDLVTVKVGGLAIGIVDILVKVNIMNIRKLCHNLAKVLVLI